uniref:Adenosine 3'-phospho 5'-phosphosulfate transporter 1 n=1 Tax=Pinguiococcus pyrenoidosus TaxID=172671 RepID=A0A7R9YCU3_9STRA|mmetsp:Transcript_1896/g.8412  ORF Transcript_1896/g.8412 Transcript_1896/m.8412 type:complete len:382 (+) Transcript_1896:79-1224(+)
MSEMRRRISIAERQESGDGGSSASGQGGQEGYSNGMLQLGCALGLQLAYVSWGVLQERIMTGTYDLSTGGEASFPSVTFLVFSNRFFAVLTAAVVLLLTRTATPSEMAHHLPEEDPAQTEAPESKGSLMSLLRYATVFAPASLSNVISSWCQYSALHYVTFPTQVLFKSNKIVPTMLMGRLLRSKKYPWRDYAEALLISLCVATFMLQEKSRPAGKDGASVDDDDYDASGLPKPVVGVLMLVAYLSFDSFTSQWQSLGFARYKLSQYTMMLGINLFSMASTLSKIVPTGELSKTFAFLVASPEARMHVLLFSLCGCVGQLFIFYTIKKFGAVFFSLIMTTRQMLSMIMSCVLFGHSLNSVSILASVVVFSVLAARIWRRYR